MRGRYNIPEKVNDAFIKTNHLIATVRKKIKDKFELISSPVHKELMPCARKKNDNGKRGDTITDTCTNVWKSKS